MVTLPISTGSANQIQSKRKELNSDDFIKMMITQLQNQDPLNPAKNSELMAQMSQIGQLQSSTKLTTTLTGLAFQNRIGAAGNLIGKMVNGLDDNNETISGLVTSVRVEKDNVYLELDSGRTLKIDNVTSIAPQRSTPAS